MSRENEQDFRIHQQRLEIDHLKYQIDWLIADRKRVRDEWEDAKRTKGSVMHDVGSVIAVVDSIINPEAE